MDNVNIFVFAKNSFPGSILSDLGLNRPVPQDVTAPNGAIYYISQEELSWVDGDILFFLAYSEEDRNNFEKLKQSPLWKTLKAIQQGQICLVDGYTWTGSNLLAADAVIDDLYECLVNTP